MCWGSSAVAANTGQVRATRTSATTTMSASAATRRTVTGRGRLMTIDDLEQLDAAGRGVPRHQRIDHPVAIEDVAHALRPDVFVQALVVQGGPGVLVHLAVQVDDLAPAEIAVDAGLKRAEPGVGIDLCTDGAPAGQKAGRRRVRPPQRGEAAALRQQ